MRKAENKKTPRRQAPAMGKRGQQGASLALRLRLLLRHHRALLVDSLLRLLRTPVASLMTWMVLGIALALPACLFLLLQNAQQFSTGFSGAASVSVYLDLAWEEAQATELAAQLRQRPELARVELILPDQALEEFQRLSGFGELLRDLDENPLPTVLVLTPVDSDPVAMEALQASLEGMPGVDRVDLDLAWLRRLDAMLDIGQRLALGMAVLLCLGVILVVGNTIRLTIESRHAEVVVVKLVGGTDAYVARPFLYTGFWYGAGGGVLASLALWLGLQLLQGPVSRLAGLYEAGFQLQTLGGVGFLLLLGLGGLLGWLGALVSVLRHLRAIEP